MEERINRSNQWKWTEVKRIREKTVDMEDKGDLKSA